ncbi:DoxX family protein [Robiginitalea sp. M366]|uniref:DoxX family protein n=1 Tax=Robiginitalea aestuariiviva TaxID=3036903 RepID=UPI00240DB771|nr:DoxX family protein [Robiginitalea aestuariiviva]MDG1572857.1 DoxX family protein [Robiginitalea aestuariiviva]
MNSSLKKDLGLLILRVAGAGLLLTHGIPKLMRYFGDEPIKFANPIGIGEGPSHFLVMFAEVICAFLVLIGLKTRWAAVPVIIAMLVAALIAHAADPIGTKEKSLLFAAIFISIFLMGPGTYSVDRK